MKWKWYRLCSQSLDVLLKLSSTGLFKAFLTQDQNWCLGAKAYLTSLNLFSLATGSLQSPSSSQMSLALGSFLFHNKHNWKILVAGQFCIKQIILYHNMCFSLGAALSLYVAYWSLAVLMSIWTKLFNTHDNKINI